MSTEPVLLSEFIAYETREAVDESDQVIGQSVLLTFGGSTLVDGQKIPGSRFEAVVPVEVFAQFLFGVFQYARGAGIIEPMPAQRCPSQLIVGTDSMSGWDNSTVIDCQRQYLHVGHHLNGEQSWTDKHAAESAAKFEEIIAVRGPHPW